MTPEVRRSWAAFTRPLSDAALGVLHRALANDDPGIADDPILYAVTYGEGLTGAKAQQRCNDILWQADRELANNFHAVTEWSQWVSERSRAEAFAELAGAVAEELDRRSRRGAVRVSVC